MIMKKLQQTRLHNPPKILGNCFSTVIACFLNLNSPEDVIQIQEKYKEDDWNIQLQEWLLNKGWEWKKIDGHLFNDSYYLVIGKTNRSNVSHVCIYKNGQLFHDPNPCNEGLITEDYFEIIEPIKKVCFKCHIEKPLSDFNKNKNHKDGLKYECRDCCKNYRNERKLEEKEYIEVKICSTCKVLKSNSEFSKCSECRYGINASCLNCINKRNRLKNKFYNHNSSKKKEYSRKWYLNNIESIKIKKKQYNIDNRDALIKYKRKYEKDRRDNDVIFKLTCNARGCIKDSFKRACKGTYKKSEKTESILGCKIPEFIEHLQSLFTNGMTLENHGKCAECWQIDHIIPISSATNEEDIIRLCHYTNLQPLWRDVNIQKSNKIIN